MFRSATYPVPAHRDALADARGYGLTTCASLATTFALVANRP